MASHTRNVAGYRLKQISRAVYEQELPKGKRRWFVRYRITGTKKSCWKYTKAFKETAKYVVQKRFDTLTDAVIAANK